MSGQSVDELCAKARMLADRGRDGVAELAAMLADADVDVRLCAVEALAQIARRVRQMRSSATAPSHADLDDEELAMALCTALADDNAHVRWVAAKALADAPHPLALFPLLKSLSDPNKHVGWAAVAALEALGDPKGIEAARRFKDSRTLEGG